MRLIAHRGARAEEPENTLRAIRRAAACRADTVEVDIRLSSDHVPVVMHDATLERTTNGAGEVSATPLEQLRALDAGKGERIPTLAEVLTLARELGIELVLELKECGFEAAVLQEITRAGMEPHVMIASFYHASVLTIKEHAPRLKTGIILSSLPVFPIAVARAARADVIFQRYPRLTGDYVAEASKENITVYPWLINTMEELETVRSLGVTGIVTDQPCRFSALV
jgi:glycerophosphoryl diester phosphodiesterase